MTRTQSVFRTLRRQLKPDAPELNFNDEELLKSYNLIDLKSGNLTVAGLLLFGKEDIIKKYFPSLRLDIIRIKGKEWGKDKDPFLSRDLKGNLLNLRSTALDFLDRFFLIPFYTDKTGERVEENAHRKILREVLTNLLMHQNYYHRSPAQVRIYNDRVEFYNPGYSLKDPSLFDSPGSELRNPLIASVFYDIGWAETKGTGLKTAIELLKEEKLPLPEYINDIKNDTFTLILPHPFTEVTPQVTEQVMDLMDKRSLTLEFCKEPRTLKEIMKFLGVKHRPTFMQNILNPLLEAVLLKRTIPDKPRSRFQKYVAVGDVKKK